MKGARRARVKHRKPPDFPFIYRVVVQDETASGWPINIARRFFFLPFAKRYAGTFRPEASVRIERAKIGRWSVLERRGGAR